MNKPWLLRLGPDGTVLSVPGEPSCPIVGTKAVKTYPSREIAGAVFAYVGDALHPDPVAFEPPPELVSPDYERFLCYTEWNTPYRFLVDNNLDPMHGTFLHKQATENGWLDASNAELIDEHGIQIAPLHYPHLSHTEIFDSVETFYRKFYFRAPKIASIVNEMVRSAQMMKRRLREGVEFFHFLREREMAH